MKSALLSLLAIASTASAHYTFPELIVGGQGTGAWKYVRTTANHYSNGPVTSVSDSAIRCYELNPGTPASTYEVNAGDSIGFTTSIGHPGPLQFYMAKAPAGKTAATFDGSGAVWFKVQSQGATFTGGQIGWPSSGKTQVFLTLPKALPSGEYLVRVEHIALHSANAVGGAQFYLSCAQIKVNNGGSGNPGPLVSFPGAYSASDPGILFKLYYPVPTSYTPPGPPVWTG
ncbi:fungal cellulose binding domain-containing protein [Paraphoma chrysanthemicola]|nr:fungal cellulose binding domain-containing protein [Paraphoma chrysanthemicola]